MKKFDMNNNMDTLPTLAQPVERYANSVAALSGGANVGVDTSWGWPSWKDIKSTAAVVADVGGYVGIPHASTVGDAIRYL